METKTLWARLGEFLCGLGLHGWSYKDAPPPGALASFRPHFDRLRECKRCPVRQGRVVTGGLQDSDWHWVRYDGG